VSPSPDAGPLWLGLRLLAGVQRLVHTPSPLPHAALDRLAAALPAADQIALDAQADRLLADLHAVISGRDPFFPAHAPPPPALLARLRAAIAGEHLLTLDYTPPGSAEPRRHTVEPLRLEQRAGLHYLIAYSHRAEATLTFRLDRLTLNS
jgi:predicted DNA-binding transcriptional regulator YafY